MAKNDLKIMTSDEVKKTQIGILNYLDDVCRENNLTYYLGAGTLIGAVRHKGFIPWDDDIDLFMKRSDYNKLIDIIGKSSADDRFCLLSLQTAPGYYYPYVKIIDKKTSVIENHMKQPPLYGVWIDIFPLDNFNADIVNTKKLKSLNLKLRLASQENIYLSDSKLKNAVKKFVHLFYKHQDPGKIAEKVEALSQTVADDTGKLFIGLSPVGDKDVFDSEWFSQITELEFEGKKYMAPVGYDNILKHRYGDYMQLPPESERVSNHDYVACWRE